MYIQSSSNKISSDQYTICAKSLLAALAINSDSKTKNGGIFSELNYMEIHVWGKETETGGRKARGREGSRDVFPNKNQLSRA